jgi:hypothetical protein
MWGCGGWYPGWGGRIFGGPGGLGGLGLRNWGGICGFGPDFLGFYGGWI